MTKFVVASDYNEMIFAAGDTREEAEQWIKDNPSAHHSGMHILEVVSCTEPYRYIE